jgi:hypothetical protein
LITTSPLSFQLQLSTFAVMFAAFVAWFSELLNVGSAGVVHFASVFSWFFLEFKGNQVFQQYLIGGVAIFIGGAVIFKISKRIVNAVLDQVCWWLCHIPLVGSFFWRGSWVNDAHHFLTIPLSTEDGQFNPEIKRIKIKIHEKYLLAFKDFDSAGDTSFEVFGETQRQEGVNAQGQPNIITGGPGQNFKLTKIFHSGPPPSWPNVSFSQIDRIM